MSNSITINIPEVALFDPQELALKVSSYVKGLAIKKHRTKQQPTSFRMPVDISKEVMAMTFADRVDLGTTDYDTLLEEALREKYQ